MVIEGYQIRYVEADAERGFPAGYEAGVATLADARRVHPRAAIVARTETDANGNVATHPFAGKQYYDPEPAPAPEAPAETPAPPAAVDKAAKPKAKG